MDSRSANQERRRRVSHATHNFGLSTAQSANESNVIAIGSVDEHQPLNLPQLNYGNSRLDNSFPRHTVAESEAEDEHEPHTLSPPAPHRRGNVGKSRSGDTLTCNIKQQSVVQNDIPKQEPEERTWDWDLDSQDSDYSFTEDEYDRKKKLERKRAARQTKPRSCLSGARPAISPQQRNFNVNEDDHQPPPPAAHGRPRRVQRSNGQRKDADDEYQDPPTPSARRKPRRSQNVGGEAIQSQSLKLKSRKVEKSIGTLRGPYATAEVIAPSVVVAAAEGNYPETYHDLFPSHHDDGTPRTEAEMAIVISRIESGTDARRSLRDWHYAFVRNRATA